MTDLPVTKSFITGSGATSTYTAQGNGTLVLKTWGAGGGSSGPSTTGSFKGGGGGYTLLTMSVATGDIIAIDAATGGVNQRGNTALGGAPGWPDGGYGGRASNANNGGGGGGGSTRVRKNGTTAAVAGGGGGGHNEVPSHGGAGGGTVGEDGVGSAGRQGGAADQSNGGAGGTGAAFSNGGPFLGGPGSGVAQSVVTSSPGGGGGGGLFGGGGGRGNVTSLSGPGGGGSGYVNTGIPGFISGSTTKGTNDQPGGLGDADYSAGIGLGCQGFASIAGGNGYVVLQFFPAGAASGGVGTVTTSAPTGFGGVIGDATAAVPTVTMGAPAAGLPTEAHVILDLTSELTPWPELVPPVAVAVGGATLPDPGQGPLVIGEITMGPPTGYYHSEDAGIFISLPNAVELSAPEGFAAQALIEPGLPVLGPPTPPAASATGGSLAGGLLGVVTVAGAPGVIASSGDILLLLDFTDVISFEAPRVFVAVGDDVVVAVGEQTNPVYLSAPESVAAVAVDLIAPPSYPGNNEGERALFRIVTTAPGAIVRGIAEIEVTDELTVTLNRPQVLTELAQNILVPIGTVFVRRAFGGAGEDPASESDFLTPIEPVIVVTPPEVTLEVGGNIDVQVDADLLTITLTPPTTLPGDPPWIPVTPPEATASVSIDLDVPLPEIDVEAPGGHFVVFDPVGQVVVLDATVIGRAYVPDEVIRATATVAAETLEFVCTVPRRS